MSEYQEYEQEYDQNLSRVRSFLSSNVRSLTTLRECERLLAQAKRCATAMENIAEEGNDTFQISESKFRVVRDVTPLMNEVDRALKEKENGGDMLESEQREMLFSGGYRAPTLGGGGDNDGDDMEMLIRNSESLLLESQQVCHSTEEMGADTLFSMGRQREQLNNASNHLAGARAHVEQAKVLLGSMSRKALRNKLFLYGVIAVLVVANIFVLIAIVKKALKKDDNA